jgi:hypothetical protein
MSARPTATIRTCVIHVLRLKREAMLKTLRVKVNDRQLRENFRSPIPLDKHSFFHEHIPDLNCRDPLHELMAKEEAEEAQKWKHITRRVEWSEAPGLDELHMSKLLATIPQRNRIGRLQKSPITKRSPERGVTQRHIKMSPTQYV